MVTLFPDSKQYWLQLASLQLQQKQEKAAFLTHQLAHTKGLLDKGSELKQLAQFHAYFSQPYEAGKILESAINSGILETKNSVLELLANYWINAKETDKAIAVLTKLIRLDYSDDRLERLAHLQLQQGQYQSTIDLLQTHPVESAYKQGKFHLMEAITLIRLQRFNEALPILEEIQGDEKLASQANRWIEYARSRM